VTTHIRVRPEVPDDVLDITAHLIEHSPDAARRFVDALPPTLAELAKAPGKGSIKPVRIKRFGEIRTWRVPGFPNHLIHYRVMPDGIEVLAVLHGAQNVARVLRRRP